MGFDNSGFLFGRETASVTKALLALDVTSAVVDEAIEPVSYTHLTLTKILLV